MRPKRLCKVSSKSDQNCDRKSDDRHTHTHTDRQTDASDFIICPMLCYSNGTDNDEADNRYSSVNIAENDSSRLAGVKLSAVITLQTEW